MLEFLALKPKAFGLDISDLSLKIIKLGKKKGVLSLASFGEAPVKEGIIQEGEIRDEDALSEIIKNALSKVKGEGLKTKYVAVSLPEEKAFLQVIQMPIMKEEELKKAVYFEAENYIPLSINEVYLDSQIIKSDYDNSDHLDVLIIALPKKIIDSYLVSLKKAELVPLVFEIESQAIARALIKNRVSPFPVLLIDLGAARTGFIVFSGYSVRFTSSVPISSEGFTKAIGKYLNVNHDKAEELKIKYGVETYRVETNIDVEARKIFEALIPSLSVLTKEIKKCLSYYRTHIFDEHFSPGSEGVRKIYLCGGGTNLKGLVDFLSHELKMPVEKGNPWVNILKNSPKEVLGLSYEKSLAFTTALGLALRGIQNNGKRKIKNKKQYNKVKKD